MARLGRSWPIQPYIRRGAKPAINATIDLDTIAIGITPHAPGVTAQGAINVPLDTIAITLDLPAPTVAAQIQATVPLDVVPIALGIPAITPTVPILPGDSITSDGQIEWNGFLLGSGTVYKWLGVIGWLDTPPVDSGDVPRPNAHGAYPGASKMQSKVITWQGRIRAPKENMEAVVADLIQATPITSDETEYPLVIRSGSTPYLVYGRIINRTPGELNRHYRVGLSTAAAIVWSATDPRRYEITARGLTVPLDADGTVITNLGNTETYPTIRIPGPRTNPSFLLNDTKKLAFTITLTEDERLDIDTKAGTIQVGDVDKSTTLATGSVSPDDFVLDPGDNDVVFSAGDTGGDGADFLWRAAWT